MITFDNDRIYWYDSLLALYNVLTKVDNGLTTRTVNSNTNKPLLKNVVFDIDFSFEEYFLKLESEAKKQPVIVFPYPLILPYCGNSIELSRENSRRIFFPDLKIDVVVCNPVLSVAKHEGKVLCHNIDRVIELNKSLNGNVSICRVTKIEKVGFSKEIDYPYYYYYTMHLYTSFGGV